jgi:PAS domain-containing protein
MEQPGEYMKKQAALFIGISQINEQSLSVEELFAESVNIISHQWAGSKITSAVIIYEDIRVTSENFRETPWFITANEMVKDLQLITVKVFNPDPTPISEGDQSIINAIAHNLASKIERILSRKELEENQKLLDKAYKLARIGTWEYDMINDILQWSDVTKEVHGFDDDYIPDVESTVQLFKEGFHRNIFAKAAHDAIEYAKPFDVELKIISGKGDERWIRATGEPEFVDGVCVRFYGISQNVTSRKQAQEDL